MRRALITGGAGFIGSHLADRLIADGVEVVVLDDFRTGRRGFLDSIAESPHFTLVEATLGPTSASDRAKHQSALATAVEGCDWVFHLQANADVRFGLTHPDLDIEQNISTTSQVLQAMRTAGVSNILLSSTGSVYGESEVVPTPEDAPFPIQTSLYGASKVAAEGLIGAYVAASDLTKLRTGVVCRFVSILGERYTHGHVVDFYRKLRENPNVLDVLGNGLQQKSYLYVGDCVEAMVTLARHHEGGAVGTHVYNLGTDETIVVNDSVRIITEYLGLSPEINRGSETRGWPGDNPLIHLDTTKLLGLGWKPTLSIAEAIERTIAWLDAPENREFIVSGDH